MALRLPVLLEASAVTCAGAPLVNDMMRKEKEHADIHERANQHRHRQRGQGLAAAWAWLKLAPRLPVLLEACPAAAAGAELPVVAGAPAANGSVWEGTPWYPRFLYETKQQVQKKWKKIRAAAAAWRALCGPGSLARVVMITRIY